MNDQIDDGMRIGDWQRQGASILLDDPFDANRPRSRDGVQHELTRPRVPLLAGHRGPPPDLILRWNVTTVPEAIDVVVHLHGFWYPNVNIARDIQPVSGLDLVPVAAPTGQGRSRPTLTVLPRGHDTGVKQRWKQKDGSYKYGYNKYTFPALTTRNGLNALVRFSLDQFAAKVHGPAPRIGRLVLTAHSGGGAALLKILEFCDPHQVHVFDALYQDAGTLAEWARRRMRRDRAALRASGTQASSGQHAREYMSTRGGALRVFYGTGTGPYSRKLRTAISTELDPALGAWYRVEASRYGHFQIPARYGWRVLADASADVPGTYTEPAEGTSSREVAVEEQAGATVTFPSGATLRVVPGPIGEGQEHFDPHKTGNPLLDTSAHVRKTSLSNSFTVGELTHSGGLYFDKARIDPELIRCLQKLRERVGKRVHVQSGYRSYAYNVKLYREKYHKDPTESRHSSGQAADVHVDGMTGMDIAKAAIDVCGPNIGVGIANTYAHVDVRRTWARWTYFGKGTEKERLAIAEIEAYRRHRIGSGRTGGPQAAPSRDATAQIAAALRRGLWETAVRIAIGTGVTDVNELTNLLFYLGHPQLRGKRIRPEQRDLAREWIEIRDVWVRPALGGVAARTPVPPVPAPTPELVGGPTAAQFTSRTPSSRRFTALAPLLERHRGDIPLDFLLGWIDVESKGRIDVVTSLNERGFFQIHPAESADHHLQHERLTTDPDYSVRAGIQLVRVYVGLARRRFPWIPFGTDLFWRIVKLQHAMGSPLTQEMLAEMRRRGAPPTSWDAIKAFELTDAAKRLHKLLRVKPGRFGRNVDAVFARGRQIAASLGQGLER